MAAGGNTSEVVLSTRLEGLQQALAGLAQLEQSMRAIGAPAPGAAAGAHGGGAAAGAESPDPLSNYYGPKSTSGPSVQPMWMSGASSTGRGYQEAPPGASAPAGSAAPEAPGVPRFGNGGTTIAPMWGGGASPMGGSVGALTVHAQNVTIYAAGGVAGAGGMPAGTVLGANGQPLTPSGGGGSGAPPAPGVAPAGVPVSGGGAGGLSLGGAVTLGGAMRQGWSSLMGMNPYAAVAGGAAMMGVNAYAAGTEPGWQVQTEFAAAAAAGHYVHPSALGLQMRTAETQSTINQYEAWLGPLRTLGLGSMLDLEERDWKVDLAKRKAAEDANSRRLYLQTVAGIPNDTRRAAPQDLDYMVAGVSASRMFGSTAAHGAAGLNYTPYARAGFSDSQMGEAMGAVGKYASSPALSQVRGAIRNGSANLMSPSVVATAMREAAAEGDWGTIGAMQTGPFQHMPGVDWNSLNALAESQTRETGVAQPMAQAAGGRVSAQIQRLIGTGAGYQQVTGAMAGQAAPMRALAESMRREAARLAPTNAPAAAGLEAQADMYEAQAASVPQRISQFTIGAESTFISAGVTRAQAGLARAMYQGGNVNAAFGGVIAQSERTAAAEERWASLPGLDPQTQEMHRAQAELARNAARIETPRAAFGYELEVTGARAGMQSAQVGAMQLRAGLYGGPGERYAAEVASAGPLQTEIGGIRRRLSEGALSEPERGQLTADLTTKMAQLAVVVDQAKRHFTELNLSIGQTGLNIASTAAGTTRMMGVGGMAGQGVAMQVAGAAGGVVALAQQRLNELVRQGASPDQIAGARQAVASAQQQEVGAIIGTSTVGLGVGMSERQSQLQYQVQVMSSLPGTYGGVRAGLVGQMRWGEDAASQLTAQKEAARKQYGDSPEWPMMEHNFNEQLRQVGMQQAGAFSALSTGWESRIAGQMLGMPGSVNYLSPSLSMRAAVGAGVMNPHMGGNANTLPFFLRNASSFASIAGSTGTQAGYEVSALTGVRPNLDFGVNAAMGHLPGGGMLTQPEQTAVATRKALEGMKIVLSVPLPDGTTRDVGGKLSMLSNAQQDVSQGGLPDAMSNFLDMRQGAQ